MGKGNPDVFGSAVLSPCDRYRYRLERVLRYEQNDLCGSCHHRYAEHWSMPPRQCVLCSVDCHDFVSDPTLPYVAWVMLNPSTADASDDDATIRRCRGYTKSWGYRRFVVGNLYGFRATLPADLKRAPEPVGPDNDRHLAKIAEGAALVVCAWGINATDVGRVQEVVHLLRRSLRPLAYLDLSKSEPHQPLHPLRLRADLLPTPWSP